VNALHIANVVLTAVTTGVVVLVLGFIIIKALEELENV